MNWNPHANEIFARALELDSIEERATYLASVCGDDIHLHELVNEMLEAHAKVGSFLDVPIVRDPQAFEQPAHQPGNSSSLRLDRFGDYRIIRELGRGGMGIVYEAEQVSLGRRVALKVLPRDLLDNSQHRVRFEREAKAAAKLHHTNIVPVFGVGEHDGQCYYVMQFIQGQALDSVLKELKQSSGIQDSLRPTVRAAGSWATKKYTSPSDCNAPTMDLARALHRSDCRNSQVNATSDTPGADGFDETLASPSDGLVDSVSTNSNQDVGCDTKHDTRGGSISRSGLSLDFHVGGGGNDHAVGKPTSYWQRVAQIGIQVAEALDYAHGQGVLHRDIKPANLVLDEQGTVWVTDFGLARIEDERGLTQTGDILGTLRYMAPETFRGQANVQSELYSLGLTLYEMLALRPAFDQTSRNVLIEQVMNAAVQPLGELNPEIPNDLCTVIHKAIEKDPKHRYGTAKAFADDLRRFHDDEPIQARQISFFEIAYRWSRRNRGLAASLATVSILVSLLAIGSSAAAISFKRLNQQLSGTVTALTVASKELTVARNDANRKADEAERQRENAERRLYLNQIASAHREWKANDLVAAQSQLRECKESLRGWEYRYLDAMLKRNCETLHGHTGAVNSLAFSGDGNRMVSASDDGTLCVWDARKGGRSLTLKGHAGLVKCVTFSPKGKTIISGGDDQTLRFWDSESGKAGAVLTGHTQAVNGVAFSPDAKHVVSASADKTLKLWDAATRELLFTLEGHEDQVHAVAFNHDGTRILSGSGDRTLKLWDTLTGKVVQTFEGHTDDVLCVAFNSDDSRIVSGSEDNRMKLWDVDSGEQLLTIGGHYGAVFCVDFSPDSRRIISGAYDNTLKLWDAGSGEDLLTFQGHDSQVLCATFSPDGKLVASGSRDSNVRLWDLEQRDHSTTFSVHGKFIESVAISPDASLIVSGGRDHRVKLWDANTGGELLNLGGHTDVVSSVAFSPDGGRIVSASWDGTVKLWDALTGTEQTTFQGHVGAITSAFFTPDGSHIISGGDDSTLKFWEVSSGKETMTLAGHSSQVTSIAISPDGQRIVSGSTDHAVKLWDLDTGTELFTLNGHLDAVRSVAFSPDGKRIVSGSNDTTLKLWDTATGKEIQTLKGHTHLVMAVAFSPDGSRIASGSWDSNVKIWDAESGDEIVTFKEFTRPALSVTFSPDASRLLAGGHNGILNLWDASGEGPFSRLQQATASPMKPVYADHLHRASLGEQTRDWYAAAFHLGWLIALHQDHTSFRQRFKSVATMLQTKSILTPTIPMNPAVEVLLARAERQEVQIQSHEQQVPLVESWRLLEPSEMTSAGGATLTCQADGSVLASGANMDADEYTLVFDRLPPRVAALRLEVLADSRLPNNGPGRHESGNFQLAEFTLHQFAVSAIEKEIPIAVTTATDSYHWDDEVIDHVLDNDMSTIWHVWGATGKSHQAFFELGQHLTLAPEDSLIIRLKHSSRERGINLGRFRLSAGTSKEVDSP